MDSAPVLPAAQHALRQLVDEAREHVERELQRDTQQALGDSVLETAQGERIFMQAANQVRDIFAVDRMREANATNPHYLNPAGNFHHENGFAPQFEVARSFMRDLRLAAEHPSAAPGVEFMAAPTPATASTHSDQRGLAAFDTNASRKVLQANLDRANSLRASVARAGSGQAGEGQPPSGPTIGPASAPSREHSSASSSPVSVAAAPTQASVMAKLQQLQQQLVQSGWQPGQPLPESLGDPAEMFAGEMHLLPPPLAAMLQGLLSTGAAHSATGEQGSSSAIQVDNEEEEGDDAWED